jgi:nucleotide-binding universal stress UspA family protein
LQYATQGTYDLLVCGTHGRGFLGRALLGSVTQELVRNSPVPVLIVPAEPERTSGNLLQRILVPVDYSAASMDAVDFAIQLSQFFKSSLVLLHAIDVVGLAATYDIYPTIVANVRAAAELRKDAANRFEKVVQERKLPGTVKTEIVLGDPPHEILRYATDFECSAIVMGSHGKKGLERALLGSVTTSVLARTKTPVFTIAAKR